MNIIRICLTSVVTAVLILIASCSSSGTTPSNPALSQQTDDPTDGDLENVAITSLELVDSPLRLNNVQYQLIDQQLFPTTIEINTDDDGKKTKIEVEYRKLDLNPSINFSFNIPEGYSPIEL